MPTSTWKVIAIGCVIAIVAALVSLALGATDMATTLLVVATVELMGAVTLLTVRRFVRRMKRAS